MVASQADAIEHEFEGAREPTEVESFHPWVLHMDRRGRSFNGRQRNRAFVGVGDGRFRDLSVLLGADSSLDGRAVVAADFDGDGDEDLFVHNLQRERHQLWRNDLGNLERAVVVELRGAQGLLDPIGAVVTLESEAGRQAQALQRGSGFATSAGPRLHFGAEGEAQLRVRWPGGAEEAFGAVQAPARVLLVQGSGTPVALGLADTQLRDPWPRGLRMPVGATVPALRLEDLAGVVQEFAPEEPAVLHFWSSACAACVSGLGRAVQPDPGEPPVVPICIDPGERRALASDLLRRAGHAGPALFAPFDPRLTEGGIGEVVDLTRLPVPLDLVLGENRVLLEVRSVLE